MFEFSAGWRLAVRPGVVRVFFLCMSYCPTVQSGVTTAAGVPRATARGGDSMGDNAAACISLCHLGYTWLPSVHAQWHPLLPLLDWLIRRGSGFVRLREKIEEKKKGENGSGSSHFRFSARLLLYLWRQHIQPVRDSHGLHLPVTSVQVPCG